MCFEGPNLNHPDPKSNDLFKEEMIRSLYIFLLIQQLPIIIPSFKVQPEQMVVLPRRGAPREGRGGEQIGSTFKLNDYGLSNSRECLVLR